MLDVSAPTGPRPCILCRRSTAGMMRSTIRLCWFGLDSPRIRPPRRGPRLANRMPSANHNRRVAGMTLSPSVRHSPPLDFSVGLECRCLFHHPRRGVLDGNIRPRGPGRRGEREFSPPTRSDRSRLSASAT